MEKIEPKFIYLRDSHKAVQVTIAAQQIAGSDDIVYGAVVRSKLDNHYKADAKNRAGQRLKNAIASFPIKVLYVHYGKYNAVGAYADKENVVLGTLRDERLCLDKIGWKRDSEAFVEWIRDLKKVIAEL